MGPFALSFCCSGYKICRKMTIQGGKIVRAARFVFRQLQRAYFAFPVAASHMVAASQYHRQMRSHDSTMRQGLITNNDWIKRKGNRRENQHMQLFIIKTKKKKSQKGLVVGVCCLVVEYLQCVWRMAACCSMDQPSSRNSRNSGNSGNSTPKVIIFWPKDLIETCTEKKYLIVNT